MIIMKDILILMAKVSGLTFVGNLLIKSLETKVEKLSSKNGGK